MTFDKEKFFKEMKDGKISKKSVVELYRLYKVYNLIKLVLEKNGKESIEKLEDEIYTIDNKVLNDKERIVLELSNITDKLNNVSDNILKNEINITLDKLKLELEELDLSDKTVLFYFKKNISLLQAKLGVENTFLLATYESFLESYRNMCIKNLSNKSYNLIKNSEYKYEVEKSDDEKAVQEYKR